MIDEEETYRRFGYRSTDLKPKSSKKVVAICDNCGKVRELRKANYRDLCAVCVKKLEDVRYRCGNGSRGRIQTEEEKEKRSRSNKLAMTVELREKISESTRKAKSKYKKLVTIKCKNCGRDFNVIPSQSDRVFCSVSCSRTWQSEHPSFKNRHHTIETKKILSIKAKNRKYSKETIEKRNETIRSKNNIRLFFNIMDQYDKLSRGYLIQCRICGQIIGQLSKHLVYKHNITIDQYKKQYPDSPTIAPKISEKIIKENKKRWLDSNYKKNIADQNRLLTTKQLEENPIFFNTSIELKMQDILTKNGYEYQTHKSCCGICIPDIIFADRKIAIFCDGDYWHNLPNYVERDRNQDKVLLENDWTPLRFWEHEINNNIEDCLYRFELEYHGGEC